MPNRAVWRWLVAACVCVGAFGAYSVQARAAGGLSANWVMQSVPGHHDSLLAVSCTSSSACMAVGKDPEGVGAFAERWDGWHWLEEPPINPSSQGLNPPGLDGVSCTSVGACLAVGEYERVLCDSCFSETLPLAERWSGGRWSLTSTPRASPTDTETVFNAISCASPIWCVAVGYRTSSSPTRKPLIETWNGRRWSVQKTSEPAGALDGVSCTSRRACTAVGYALVGPLAERWDGRHWVTQNTPNLHDAESGFSAVSCSSDAACTAVGEDKALQPLVERWAGSRWSIQAAPQVPDGLWRGLRGVSCRSRLSCIAVGGTNGGSAPSDYAQTVALRWNGSTWTREATPSASTNNVGGSGLYAVSCTSIVVCTAVGWGDRNGYALAEQRAATSSARFAISRVRAFANGTIRFQLDAPGAGVVEAMATAWTSDLAHVGSLLRPAPNRFVFARRNWRTSHAGTVTMTVTTDGRGRSLLAHHRFRVVLRLWVAFNPRNGRPHEVGIRGIHLPDACAGREIAAVQRTAIACA